MRMREDKTKKGDRVVGRSCDKLLNEAECVRELFSHTHTHTHTHTITLSFYHSITLSLYHSITQPVSWRTLGETKFRFTQGRKMGGINTHK